MLSAGDRASPPRAALARLLLVAGSTLLVQCAPKPATPPAAPPAADAAHPERGAERAALLVSLQTALGQSARADEQAAFDREAALLRAGGPAARADLAARLNGAAARYLDLVEQRTGAGAAWPADRPAKAWAWAAAVRLVALREEIAGHAAAGEPPEAALHQAAHLLALASGAEASAPDPFGDVTDLVRNGASTLDEGPAPRRPAP